MDPDTENTEAILYFQYSRFVDKGLEPISNVVESVIDMVLNSSAEPDGLIITFTVDQVRDRLLKGYQSTHHAVMSSHGQLITGQLVTDTSHHSQLVTSEHITKPPVPVVIILSARHQETSRNIA